MSNKSLKIFLSMVLLCSFALAIPGIPHQFYGSVMINGAPAPDGTVVSARINGEEVASGVTTGGKYGQAPDVFLIPDADNNREGKTISFFVAGKDTGITAIFHNGASTRLDLSVTIIYPSGNTGGSSGGSSSRHSSGGGSYGGGGAVVDTEQAVAEYQVGDIHVTRSYYYDGNNVVMKLTYENTGSETLYNVDVVDDVGGEFGTQTAYFHAIEPGEKKYDEYELGKWVSLYQMNEIIKGASSPTITVGQVGETKEKPAPEPEKPETTPRDEGVIKPQPSTVEESTETASSQATGFLSLGTGALAVGGIIVIAIIAAVLIFYMKRKKRTSKARKTGM